MSNETNGLADLRELHDAIVNQVKRTPADEENRVEPISTAENTPKAQDIGYYIARVQRAARVLEQSTNHAREMEAILEDFRDQQMQLKAGLDEAARTNAGLKESLAAERNRAAWAHAVALKAVKRAQDAESAVAVANARADALTSAIDSAFGNMVDNSASEAAAAA